MRIYPSTPIEQHSMLIKGLTFSNRIKKLANPGASISDSSYFSDTNIVHIKRTSGSPGINISDIINVANTRNIPIYAWFDFDNKTIYLKSNCKKIFLNDDAAYSFYKFTNLENIAIRLYTSNRCYNLNSMFYDCSKLTSLDVSNFDTSKVTNMSYMFRNCSKLTSLDLSNFDTSKVTNMNQMFYNCSSLTLLNLSNFDTSKVTDMSYMFSNCSSLTSLDLSNFNTSKVTTMSNMFYYCSSLTSLNLSSFDTSNVTTMGSMFSNCEGLTSLNVSNWNTSNVTNMSFMFRGCRSLISLDLSSFDTSNVKYMNNMLYECGSLTSVDVSKFNTSNVTDISDMFYDCISLTSVDVSNFNTSNVTDMSFMFQGCRLLTSVDVSNFNTSKVTTMYSMFIGCLSLTSLDLSGFDTSNVTTMNNMFHNCSSLIYINYGNNFKISDTFLDNCIHYNIYNPTGYMYYNCPANKPNHKSWIKNGAWTSSGYYFLKTSKLLSGSEVRSVIDTNTTSISSSSENFIATRYNITYDRDDRVFIRHKNNVASFGFYNTVDVELNEDCSGMFKGLPELTNIDISHQYFNYNGAKTRNWKEMFADNPKLTTIIYPTNFDIPEDVFPNTLANDDSNPTWHMFHNSPNATKPTGKFWDMGTWNDEGTFIRGVDIDITKFKQYVNNKQMTSFKKADAPPESMVDVFDISKDGNMAIMTWFDSGNSTQYWYSDNPMIFMDSDSSDMFNGSNVCISIDLSGFDTRKTENMLNMFRNCSSLTSLDVSNFDTSNVTNMSYMFYDCKLLTSLDVSNFNTSKVTNMSYMFSTTSLTSVDVSNFNTSKVINMTNMFYNCSSLTSLDLFSFDTSSITYKLSYAFTGLFYNCSNLLNIIFSNKFILNDSLYNNVSTDGKVSATNMMYKECPANKPTGGNWDLGTWDSDGTFIKNT